MLLLTTGRQSIMLEVIRSQLVPKRQEYSTALILGASTTVRCVFASCHALFSSQPEPLRSITAITFSLLQYSGHHMLGISNRQSGRSFQIILADSSSRSKMITQTG